MILLKYGWTNGFLYFCFTGLVHDRKRGLYAYSFACQIVFNVVSHYFGEKCTPSKSTATKMKEKRNLQKQQTKHITKHKNNKQTKNNRYKNNIKH